MLRASCILNPESLMSDPILLAVIFAVVAFSHGMAALPFARKLVRRELPSSFDFCAVAFLLYYDLGLLCELCGLPYASPFLPSFSHATQDTQLKTALLLIAAPWLLKGGVALVQAHGPQAMLLRKTTLCTARKNEFYVLCLLIVAVALALGGYLLSSHIPLWMFRVMLVQSNATTVLLTYIPMCLLAFYVQQTNSLTGRGTLIAIGLLLASLCAALPTAERTNLLLPLVIFLLFRRLRLSSVIGLLAVCLLTAAILLPVLRWQYIGRTPTLTELADEVIYNDLAKHPMLADIIERSADIGTRILPYPGAGYVYSLLFYAPRGLTPFKGYATAIYYTADITHFDPAATGWGLATGGLEEIVLNFGYLLCFPLLIFYGLAIGMIDYLSNRYPAFVVPARLGSFWLIAKHLPAVLLIFGTMAIVIWLLQWRYVERKEGEAAPCA